MDDLEKFRNEHLIRVDGVDYPVDWTFGPGGLVRVIYNSHTKTAYLQTWPKKERDAFAMMIARELVRDVLRENNNRGTPKKKA